MFLCLYIHIFCSIYFSQDPPVMFTEEYQVRVLEGGSVVLVLLCCIVLSCGVCLVVVSVLLCCIVLLSYAVVLYCL